MITPVARVLWMRHENSFSDIVDYLVHLLRHSY